ncbi:MAG: SCO family protein, partial [Caldilineaceae bacterium]|nr:SCO family protein [Caldilineaceae bacterium]
MNTLLTLRRAPVLVAFVLTLLLSACAPHQYTALVFQEDSPAADIVGTDYSGETYRLSDHRGELSLIFFGYTFCPDVCPLTLGNMSQTYKILEDESPNLVEDLNVLFVSVDPERDTP